MTSNKLYNIKTENKRIKLTVNEFLNQKNGDRKDILTPKITSLVSSGLIRLYNKNKTKKKFSFFKQYPIY